MAGLKSGFFLGFKLVAVKIIPETYSCVTTTQKPATTKLLPAVKVQVPAATTHKPTTAKSLTAATKQMSAANKIHTATTRKHATTKLLPTANMQMPTAIEQIHTATVQAPDTLSSPTCKPSANQATNEPACHLPATYQPLSFHASRPVPISPLGNSQIGQLGKAISPKPNLGGAAAQFESLPNGEWNDRLSNNENHAPNLVNEFRCMKKTQLALCQCKLGSSQTVRDSIPFTSNVLNPGAYDTEKEFKIEFLNAKM
ncbi:hypothetical protein DSO57_1019621 [Entomophthora muscae]|uniref:Uncharacterized protein n=1 Tax=Entomophthora muscae TaxID=34485 RepID=A0ACC2ST53_9FUNG|nr:hypothetical protein DSO57_1019621 [Entomophthora muscae]